MSRAAELATEGGSRCPVCGGAARPDIDAGDFRLFRCCACGSWSSDAQLRGASGPFRAPRLEPASGRRRRFEALLTRLPDRCGGIRSLLDVGCGRGEFLAHAARRIPRLRAEGIERDEIRAAQARAANLRARIHTGDALELAERIAGPFDLITLWNLLERVSAPSRLLAALARRLAPSGRIHLRTLRGQSLAPEAGRWCYRLSRGRLRQPLRLTHEPHQRVFLSRPGLEHAATLATLRIGGIWREPADRAGASRPAWLGGEWGVLLERVDATPAPDVRAGAADVGRASSPAGADSP